MPSLFPPSSRRFGSGLGVLVGLIALAGLAAGCAAPCKPSTYAFDLDTVLEVKLLRADDLSDEAHRHCDVAFEPGAATGGATVFHCAGGWVQRGTWEKGAPRGKLTLLKGQRLRFEGEVDTAGELSGTVYTTATELGIKLTGSPITEAYKARVRERLAKGAMPAPLFTGRWRARPDGSYVPHRGQWFEVERDGAEIRAWEEGVRGEAGFEGWVARFRTLRSVETLDPKELEGALEHFAEYRGGKLHGMSYRFAIDDKAPPIVSSTAPLPDLATLAELATATTPYVDGLPHGDAQFRTEGTTRRGTYENGKLVAHVEVLMPSTDPVQRECYLADGRNLDVYKGSLSGWRYVEPRAAPPYMVFHDGRGRRIEETQTPLPEGIEGFEALRKDTREVQVTARKRWVGQVRDGRPQGWGRLYDPDRSPITFEEGFFDDDRPRGYTARMTPRPDQPTVGHRYLELYKDGAAVPARHEELTLWTVESERKAAEERRYWDEEARKLNAKLWWAEIERSPSAFKPTLIARMGVVRWSNGLEVTGVKVDPAALRGGEVVWIKRAKGSRFGGVDGPVSGAVKLTDGWAVPPADILEVRRYTELERRYSEKFFPRTCSVCAGKGTSGEIRYKIEHVQRSTPVRYVDHLGGTVGWGVEGSSEMVSTPVQSGCRTCDGKGTVGGEWARGSH